MRPVLEVSFTLDSSVEDFDSKAQSSFRTKLAGVLPGIEASDITILSASPGSIVVKTQVAADETDVIATVATTLQTLTTADLSDSLGFTVTAMSEPAVRFVNFGSLSFPMPSAPPLDEIDSGLSVAGVKLQLPVLGWVAGGLGGLFIIGVAIALCCCCHASRSQGASRGHGIRRHSRLKDTMPISNSSLQMVDVGGLQPLSAKPFGGGVEMQSFESFGTGSSAAARASSRRVDPVTGNAAYAYGAHGARAAVRSQYDIRPDGCPTRHSARPGMYARHDDQRTTSYSNVGGGCYSARL